MKTNARSGRKIALRACSYGLAAALCTLTLALAWLRWDAGRPREEWFDERQGTLVAATPEFDASRNDVVAKSLELGSDSGLRTSMRVVRPANPPSQLPVLLILGGHRTGSDAVDLLGSSTGRAIVALDYPYDGPERVRGFLRTLSILPAIRQAFLDTPPSIALALDWLVLQPWVDRERIFLVGASLGVPFAATAAARDERISGLMLVHGAADNRLWLEANIARRMDRAWLQPALATILHWVAYGPVFDTRERVAAVAPRPVLIVGARDDERTPAGQTEQLFEAAGEPKKMRWTDGQHIEPGRTEIIRELLSIADEELSLHESWTKGGQGGRQAF